MCRTFRVLLWTHICWDAARDLPIQSTLSYRKQRVTCRSSYFILRCVIAIQCCVFAIKPFDHNSIVQYCDSWGGRDGQVYGLRKCTMTYILSQRIKSFSSFYIKLCFYPVDDKYRWVQSTLSRVILIGQ